MNQPSIKKNYIYRLSYEVLVIIVPFITTPYISRILGAEGIGIYSYTSSIMAYFTLFAALGTASYGAREIAQHRDDRKQASKLFWEIELMTVGTSTVCLIFWILLIIFSSEYRYYYMALLPTLLATMMDISWYFTGYEQVKYIVTRNSFCKIAGVILLFTFVKQKEDLILYMLINSGINLLGNISMWTYLPKILEKVDWKELEVKKHFQETLIYFVPTIATSIYTVLDKTLIGIITESSYQNGYYEQATKIVAIVKTFTFGAVNSVMGARISYLFAENKLDEIHRRIEKSMNFIFLIGFGFVFGIIGVAKNFVPLFMGEGYEPVICLLYLMAPLVVIIGVSNCLGSQYFTPSGQKKKSAKFIIIGSVLNLCLNLILIPKWGAYGAVVASLMAELAISALYITFSKGYMSHILIWKLAWKRMAAGIIMCVVVYELGEILMFSPMMLLIVQVVAGVGIYGCVLIVLRDDMLKCFFETVRKKVKKVG